MVVSFLGTKGGTGTTTLAVNCAAELRRVTGLPTVVVDLKPGTGDVGLFLGVRSKFTLLDLLDQLDWIDARAVPAMLARHDCGLDVLPGAPDYGRPGSSDAPDVELVDARLGPFGQGKSVVLASLVAAKTKRR